MENQKQDKKDVCKFTNDKFQSKEKDLSILKRKSTKENNEKGNAVNWDN